MAATVENVEKNKVKLTFTLGPEEFEQGIQKAYNKNKAKFNLPGFRKGKAPRKFIEASYGKEIFYEDAINVLLPDAYDAAIKEAGLDTVARPEIDVTEISAESGAVIVAEVYTKPGVSISDYKGVAYTPADVAATEEEIHEELKRAQEKNARIITIEDRPVQKGDITVIDFEGFIDGVPFEGGKAENYELTIGSGSFIDTFEDQIIGKNTGDAFEVNVKFPEDYGQESLQGKPAVFKVKVNEIKFKEMPELNDEFAQDVSEFDTLDEYKTDVKTKIEERKQQQAEQDKEDQIVKAVVAKAEIDLPQVMIDNQVESMVRDFANRLQRQGMNMETYMMYTGMDEKALRESYAENAELQVRARLCLEAVAALENIAVIEEEIDEEIGRIASMYHMEKEKLLEVMRAEEKEGLVKDLKTQKALQLLLDNAIVA